MSRRPVMSSDAWEEFRAFLRAGLEHYGVTPAKAGKQFKRKRTAEDLKLEEMGLQKRWSPLAAANYSTPARVGKLIENTIYRRVNEERARLALFALESSVAAISWRQLHGGFENDVWFWQLQQKRQTGVTWARLPQFNAEAPDPLMGARVMIVPGAEATVAAAIVQDLYDRKLLSKSEIADASRVVTSSLANRAHSWASAFRIWVDLGDSLRNVRIVETVRENQSGIGLRTVRTVVSNKFVEGDPAPQPEGRPPTHAEFLEAIYVDALRHREINLRPDGFKTREPST